MATALDNADDVLGVEIRIETEEREAADGFLSGKYTLQVIAGDVVTGMEITSSTATNAGTVSDVTFQADRFKIYSGTTKKVIFVADAIQDKVRMADVFTVDGAALAIYIKTTAGAGSYNSAGTPFFVDSLGRMSLGTGLTFDGTNLTISGSITATSGSIGGWDINASTLSKNNAILDSAGQLILGTSNDVVYLSATDGTYRLWVGNVTAGSAAFSVTKAGVMTAVNGVFSGSITSTSGAIGGFSIGTDYLRDTGDTFGLASTVTGGNDVRFWAGNTFANRATAPLRFYEDGSGVLGGFTVMNQGFSAGSGTSLVSVYSGGGFTTPGMTLGDDTAGAALIISRNLIDMIGFSGGIGSTSVAIYPTGRSGFIDLRTLGVLTIQLRADTGDISATTFTGSGASLTALNASNLGSGTVPDARFPATLPALSGVNLTALNASNIASGTLNNSRLPSAISVSTVDTTGDVSANELNIAGVEVINNSGELISVAIVLNDSSGVKCNLRYDAHAGADTVFANYMKIFANGSTVYVPYTSSAP